MTVKDTLLPMTKVSTHHREVIDEANVEHCRSISSQYLRKLDKFHALFRQLT